MEVLRTPDERFASLPAYPFAPHYAQVDGLRLHYLDEGPRNGPVALLLHGEPSWSYLYRKLVPILADAGLRAVAPSANLDAQADLVVGMVGRVFRVRVSAGPSGADGAARFEVRVASEQNGRIQEIEGALTVERDRVVILALPDPHKVFWGGGIGPGGATVFVVLSSRTEEPDRHALAEQIVEPPILINGPEPRYPEDARSDRATGRVVVRALVRKDGTVDDPQIQEAPTGPGAKSMVNAALAAVSERTYLPARSRGEPVETYVTVTIEFKEDGASILDEPGE